MANMVTRCPQCKTSFRITPTQIQKAKGAVRCGSCLHIFNAEQHLIEGAIVKPKTTPRPAAKAKSTPPPEQTSLAIEEPKTPAAPSSEGATPHQSKREKSGKLLFDQEQIDRESEQDDDFLISDDMDQTSAPEEDILYVGSKQEDRSLFDRKPHREEQEFIDDSDESWAESLLREDNNVQAASTPSRADNLNASEPSEYSTSLDADEFIFDNDEPDTYPDVEPDTTYEAPPAEPTDSSAPAPRFHLHDNPDEEPAHSESLRAYDSDRTALLMGIDQVPVEMTDISSSRWRSRLLWGGLSFLALLALVAQVAWLQFDRLASTQTYRPYYQAACDALGCTLPAQADKSRIKAYNLVVRNHPEVNSALMVDAMILNNAPFAQRYPNLRLVFTSTNNKPVASREFTPAEYLRGELAGSTIMPSKQPIHLSLELADPGPEAVNYRMEIR
ncbi:DUF3426 domain-containing protein [Gilvimarinus chinensis]|uniref:DUF3426 domain-containing protein n=1 Tax=Gilvimarinus chinensis TaxID=396005 RepID=UPI000368A738|nr:DUF3426 domain-containing protein [Gilvimarinus chinensis]